MNKFLLIIQLIIIPLTISAQNANWARRYSGTDSDELKTLRYKDEHTFYLAGTFKANFLSDRTTLTAAATNDDAFIGMYYSYTGGEAWIKQIRSYSINPKDMRSNGDVVLTGYFDYEAEFSPDYKFINTGDKTGFVARYSGLRGDVKWVNTFHSSNGGYMINSIDTDDEDNIFIGGNLRGSISIGENTYTPDGTDMLICKLEPAAGQIISVNHFVAPSEQEIYDIDEYKGEIFVAGYFYESLNIAGQELFSLGNRCSLVTKIGADNTHKWAKYMGYREFMSNSNIEVSPNGDLIYSGNEYHLKVIMMDLDGQEKWTFSSTGNGSIVPYAMRTTSEGIYITGGYTNNIILQGSTPLWRSCTCANNADDCFVASFNNDGSLRWVNYGGGSSLSDDGLSIDVYNDNLLVCGKYQSSSTFFTDYKLGAYSGYQTEGFAAQLTTGALVTGLDQQKKQTNSIQYNPVLQTLSTQEQHEYRWEVYTLDGRKVAESPAQAESLDISNIPSGVYIINCRNDSEIRYIKLMK